jgi:hypothetical protein
MRHGQSSSPGGFQLDATPLVVSAALIGAGSLIGLTGLVVGGAAVVSAARRWFGQQDVQQVEVVKHKVSQTRAATSAGAAAWKHHDAAGQVHA